MDIYVSAHRKVRSWFLKEVSHRPELFHFPHQHELDFCKYSLFVHCYSAQVH